MIHPLQPAVVFQNRLAVAFYVSSINICPVFLRCGSPLGARVRASPALPPGPPTTPVQLAAFLGQGTARLGTAVMWCADTGRHRHPRLTSLCAVLVQRRMGAHRFSNVAKQVYYNNDALQFILFRCCWFFFRRQMCLLMILMIPDETEPCSLPQSDVHFLSLSPCLSLRSVSDILSDL